MKKIILFYMLLMVLSCFAYSIPQTNLIKHKSNYFVENKGQWNSNVRYFTRIAGMNAWITDDGVVYDFYKINRTNIENNISDKIQNEQRIGNVIKMTFVDSNINLIQGIGKLCEYNNYFFGNNKSKWVTNVPLYRKVQMEELYNGISARFYYDDNMLRYDFVVKPNSNISKIKIKIEGSSELFVDNGGELVIKINIGIVREGKIYAYQIVDGNKTEVKCRFEQSDNNTVFFNVGKYDKSLPLIIDPITYSTFIGGGSNDEIGGLSLNVSNDVYISGSSYSPDFPTTSGAYQENRAGSWDVFICKLNSSGTSLDYSTYIGGSGQDYGTNIAIDGSNNIYLTGHTSSSDFPTTVSAYDTSYNNNIDIFVCKLNSSGTSLDYSTYIGGSSQDYGESIALDDMNNAYVTGYTSSSNFPITSTAFDTVQNGFRDVFVCKLNSSGSELNYSTYIGGIKNDEATSIALDGSNNIYLTGNTYSSDFPTTTNAYDTDFNSNGGIGDAFVCKLKNDFSALIYSTFLGGHDIDLAQSIALDQSNNAYITGYTNSSDFPITSNSYDSIPNGSIDVFLTKLNSMGSSLEYSTFIGGIGADEAYALTLDKSNNAYITGFTNSYNFPTTSNAYDTIYHRNKDVFLCKINNTGSTLDYSTFLGDTNDDEAYCIALDKSNNVYIAGQTKSIDFPITFDAYDTSQNGLYDVFVTKFNLINLSILSLTKSAFCEGEFINIPFKVSGNFNSNNQFIAQLSDETGDFSNPIILASLNGTNSGMFKNVEIPKTLSEGTKYRIRIVSTNPVAVGNKSIDDLSIFALPKPEIISGQNSVCTDNLYTYLSNEVEGVDYKWSVSSGTIISSEIESTVDVIWGSQGMGKLILTQTNANACMDSAIMNISIYPLPQPEIISGRDSVCSGSSSSYSSNIVYSIEYKWSVIGGEIIGNDNEQTVNILWDNQETGKITLTQIDGIGCQDSVFMPVRINSIPVVKYSAPITKVCIDDPEFELSGGIPEGGIYSGSGVIEGVFNPNMAGEGEHLITYTYSENGCENSATQVIKVNPLPEKPTISENEKTLTSSFAISYQWYLNDIKITGADKQSYKPSEEGNYKVEIINEFACKNISDEYYFNPVFVNTRVEFNNHLSIIPNPVTAITTIAYSLNKSAKVSLSVTNSLGIVVAQVINCKPISEGQHFIKFDTRELATGVYYCNLSTEEYTETVKIIIVK